MERTKSNIPQGIFNHDHSNGKQRLAKSNGANPDRLPPHSEEAEQGVLGCILWDPKENLPAVAEKIDASGEAFYDLKLQTIFSHMMKMSDSQKPVDIITLQQSLKDVGLLEQVGGIQFLNTLQDSVPSAANLVYYLDIVEEKFLLRKLIQACTATIAKVYSYNGEATALLDEVERDILQISTNRNKGEDQPIRKLVNTALGEIEAMFESQGRITGLATGFADLDAETDGMQPGDMIILSGFPSTGKTSLAMNIVEHVALELNMPVAVFSHEMTPAALVRRMLASRSRLNLRDVRQGIMHDSDFPKLTASSGKLAASNLHVIKSSGHSVGQIKAKARRLHQQHGIKLFVVDYLQKVRADGRVEKRSDAVAQVSGALKDLAMELNIPGLVLSQLNSEGGLFMSSETGMDADSVWKLRVDKSSDDWNNASGVPVELDIEKQRNGATRSIPLTFLRSITRYESAARVQDEDTIHGQ